MSVSTASSIRRRRTASMVALLVTASFHGPSFAGTALQARWACWYDHALHLACTPEFAPPSRAVDSAEVAPASRTSLPPVVENIRQRPDRWQGRIVRIPLHTEPFDDASSSHLAQSILCGAREDCRAVMVKGEAWSLEAAAALADLHDPLFAPAR